MIHENGELDHVTLRELAFFTLAGAYLYGSDTMHLPSSVAGDSKLRPGSASIIATVCVVWVVILGILRLTR